MTSSRMNEGARPRVCSCSTAREDYFLPELRKGAKRCISRMIKLVHNRGLRTLSRVSMASAGAVSSCLLVLQ